jgi:hypothetical protein
MAARKVPALISTRDGKEPTKGTVVEVLDATS